MRLMLSLAVLFASAVLAVDARAEGPKVKIETSHGEIIVELNPEKAPISVANFLQYVNDKFYDGTVFHRVIKGFMIQGGGFTADLKQKPTRPPIKLEARNGLSNLKGTIAMARTMQQDSATAQFFLNHVDNPNLDAHGGGYAVFGKVVSGMDVVEKIAAVATSTQSGMRDVPAAAVTIKSIRKL